MRLVDADKLKEDMIRGCRRIGKEMGVVLPTSAFVNIIDNVPPIEYTFEEAFQKTVCENKLYCPKRPHGRWLTHQAGMLLWEECNQCKAQVGTIGMNYCPNCGAKMDGGEEE